MKEGEMHIKEENETQAFLQRIPALW